MKRALSLLLAALLLLSLVPALGEDNTPAGDNGETVPMDDASEQEPVATDGEKDAPEEDTLEEEIVEGRELQYGDEGEDVLELQTRLKEMKYYTGNLSGRYREGTREAVRSFQADFGLEETGIADTRTQSLLYSAMYRPLRYGSTGEDVKALQTRLMELGYYKGKISGNYLEGTQNGIRTFQEKSGFPVTGVADPATQEALFNPGAVGKNDGTAAEASTTPLPDGSNFLVDDNETALGNGVVMADEPVDFTKALKSGSSGSLVKQLQTRMAELGYYDGPISGNFAKKTLRAVKKIQTQNGMEATGRVDEATWNVIFNDSKIVMPENTAKPTPSPTPVPFAITVDVANQVTTVYGRDENGEYNVVVKQMLCSTGTKNNPSDVGDWVLNGRHATWCTFPKWANSYARYWTRINSSIAFHSVLYTAVSNTALDVSSYKKLGNRASHGCVRLTVADAKWIYDNIGAGTVVSIVEGMKADPELRDSLKLPALNRKTMLPEETPLPTAEPVYNADEKPADLEKTLKKNSESPTIFWAQHKLTDLGFYTGKCSGKILNGTVEALKAFQRSAGLRVNGTLDQNTLDALYEAGRPTPEPTAESTPDITPESTPDTMPDPTPTPTLAPGKADG